MEAMEQGIELDQEMLIQVLQNRLAQAVIREAQMESAIQSQAAEISGLRSHMEAFRANSEVEEA